MMLADNDRARPGTERPSEREKARTMRQRNFNSQALRQLAEELLSQIAEEGALTAEEREDLTTALVRQWIHRGLSPARNGLSPWKSAWAASWRQPWRWTCSPRGSAPLSW